MRKYTLSKMYGTDGVAKKHIRLGKQWFKGFPGVAGAWYHRMRANSGWMTVVIHSRSEFVEDRLETFIIDRKTFFYARRMLPEEAIKRMQSFTRKMSSPEARFLYFVAKKRLSE